MRVVRGAAAIPVARLGGFAPRIDVLARSPDSAVRALYAGFRAASNRSTAFTLGGFAAGVVALIAYRPWGHGGNRTGGYWLLGGSVVLSLGQIAEQKQAMDRLESAIWLYNRNLRR
jgi:hypothetical protein